MLPPLVLFLIRSVITLVVLKPVIEWFLKRRKFVNTVNKIPGYMSFPLIGSTWLTWNMKREDIINIALARSKLYPKGISRAWLGPIAEVRVDTAELAQQVLMSKKCFAKAQIYRLMIGPWIGEGLVLAIGDRWFKHRRLITTAFHFEVLNRYCEVFRERSEVLVEVIEEKVGDVFDLAPYLYRFSFDVVLETAFGVQINVQRDPENEYLKAAEEIGEIAGKRVKNVLLHNDFLYQFSPLGRRSKKVLGVLHGFSNKVIADRRRELMQEDPNNNIVENGAPSFIDLLLRDSQRQLQLTDDEIRAEVDTFMFAGHDTTATALCWIIFLIGNHPEIQNRIYEEQVALFGDVKTTPNQTDLRQMEYLERVIQESLRIQPSAPVISRQVTEDMELNGYTIPAGCMLSVNVYQIHRDPRYFPNPEKFDPDRFLPENFAGVDPFTYLPFSAGPRGCIGQRFSKFMVKTAMATLCRNYKMHAIESLDQIQTLREFVARPAAGIKVRIEKR